MTHVNEHSIEIPSCPTLFKMIQSAPGPYSHIRSEDSDSDAAASLRRHAPEPSISNPSHCTATHEDSRISTTLKEAQLQLEAVKQRNRLLEEQNTILEANKPSHKTSKVPSQLVAFDEEVKMFAKKYGVMYEMYPPSTELLKKTLPSIGLSFDRPARYANSAAEADTLLSELRSVLPDHLHHLISSNHFHKTLQQALEAGRSSELIKLQRVGGHIFRLSSDYFVTSAKQDTIDELFVDTSNSTVFGNWKPLAQILKAVLMGEASLTSVKKGGPPRNHKIWGVSTITPGAIAWSATIIRYSLNIFGAMKLPVDAPDGEDFTAQIALAMAGLQSNDANKDLDSTPGPGDSAQGIEITQSPLNSPLLTPRLSVVPEIPSSGSSTPLILPLAPAVTVVDQNLPVFDDTGDVELNERVTGTIHAEDHAEPESHTQGRRKKKSGQAAVPRKSVRQKIQQ
ncbi:hypothetical protein DEU56DRAFT_762042 [Suillus clintonianus]|uniref:uncharacterized protein n=1 Tax=Suillus clintonianus TaxID=1904413 RepID=UPI001B86A5D6|nr:uncharacterized protein DEU56DRAFT_762042 [Suillus clintonianus]KAG2112435.1 hypothetical protein DEU56DRAFT_762042 [Suillus clintonianus]